MSIKHFCEVYFYLMEWLIFYMVNNKIKAILYMFSRANIYAYIHMYVTDRHCRPTTGKSRNFTLIDKFCCSASQNVLIFWIAILRIEQNIYIYAFRFSIIRISLNVWGLIKFSLFSVAMGTEKVQEISFQLATRIVFVLLTY